jgi:hypothetical protein
MQSWLIVRYYQEFTLREGGKPRMSSVRIVGLAVEIRTRHPLKTSQKHFISNYCWCRDSSVGVATGWTAGVQFPARGKRFSLLHSVQTGSGAHPASYPMGTGGGSFPG